MRPYLGPPWTNSCQIWCVKVFHHVLLKYDHENAEMQKSKFDDVTLQYSILFNGGQDFFSLRSLHHFEYRVSLSSFALVRFSRYQNFEVWKMAFILSDQWIVGQFLMKTSNFCVKVEKSNFILVPNSVLSTNVFLQSKCNMHGRYDHASWSWRSCIALSIGTEFGNNPDSSLIMPDFDLTGELSLKIELHMLRSIRKKYTLAMGQFH